jgi:hypothetical protein
LARSHFHAHNPESARRVSESDSDRRAGPLPGPAPGDVAAVRPIHGPPSSAGPGLGEQPLSESGERPVSESAGPGTSHGGMQ